MSFATKGSKLLPKDVQKIKIDLRIEKELDLASSRSKYVVERSGLAWALDLVKRKLADWDMTWKLAKFDECLRTGNLTLMTHLL